ncbi:MAG: (2Fe-2S) ferredoxin domain-containing protein [Bacteroidales bacterium]
MENKTQIVICLGSSCFSRGNAKNLEIIKDYLEKNNLNDKVDFRGKLCSGNCNKGPVIIVNDKTYENVEENCIPLILDEYF